MKTIFLYTTQGFSVRYLLKTRILDELVKSGNRIVILSEQGGDPLFRRQFQRENVIVQKINAEGYRSVLQSSRIQRTLILFRAFVLNSHFDTTTVDNFRSIFIEQAGWGVAAPIAKRLIGLLWNMTSFIFRYNRLLRKLLVKYEARFFAPLFHNHLYRAYSPDLVLVTALCGFQFDEFVAREAKFNCVPVCSIILSWDNTTGLGLPGYYPDHVIAWTEIMKTELITLSDIPSKSIFVGGVAHFDHYYSSEGLIPKKDFFDGLNLDLERATIFFATKSPKRFPWGPLLSSKILDAINSGCFVRPVQLLIRLHPLHFRKDDEGCLIFQEILDAYKELEKTNKNIVINWPTLDENGIAFDLDQSEVDVVKSILTHSDVMVNMFSTMVIEAAIFNLPSINICIKDEFRDPSGTSRRNLLMDYVQTHNQRLISSGAAPTAWTYGELVNLINASLDDRSLGSKARSLVVEREAGIYRGTAGATIAQHICDLVQDSSP